MPLLSHFNLPSGILVTPCRIHCTSHITPTISACQGAQLSTEPVAFSQSRNETWDNFNKELLQKWIFICGHLSIAAPEIVQIKIHLCITSLLKLARVLGCLWGRLCHDSFAFILHQNEHKNTSWATWAWYLILEVDGTGDSNQESN